MASQGRQKLVFISNMAAPYQVKYCYALQKYFDAEFWFYEYIRRGRPAWWKTPLGNRCKILPSVVGKRYGKYYAFDLLSRLRRFNPDIIIIGGLTIPSNYIAYRWGLANHRKILAFTEFPRQADGTPKIGWMFTKLIPFLYRKIDLLLVSGLTAMDYYTNECKFNADHIVRFSYPADVEGLAKHPYRTRKAAYTYIFPHRLTPAFRPLLAIDIFAEINRRYPGSKLLLNASGELRSLCEDRLRDRGICKAVSFLDHIRSWDHLHEIYSQSDICLSPCGPGNNGCLSITELGASGAGIIVSDEITNTSKRIKDLNVGFVVNATVDCFVEAAEQYHKHPELFRAHADVFRDDALQRGPTAVARKLASLIHGTYRMESVTK